MSSSARVKLLGLLIALPVCLNACGCSGPLSGIGGNRQPSLSSITVTPAGVTLITGQTKQLAAIANYSDGSKKDVTSTAAWSSSNSAVAAVCASGLVTSVSAGQASISAALPGASGSDPVTVNAKALTSIAVTPATVTLIAGQTRQLAATSTYNDGSTGDVTSSVTWSSSNTAVATVSASGLVTSLAAGQVNVSATLSGVSGSDAVTVNAKMLRSIQVSPTSATLAMGISQQFFGSGTYNDGSTSQLTQGVTWASSSPAIAAVSGSGVVATLSQGSTTITATSGSVQGSVNIVVNGASGGPVLVDDLTDSRVLIATGSDQSSLTFFGTRDSNGNPLSLTGVRRQVTDGTWQNISIDSQGRPTAVVLSDNTQFHLNWTSNASAVLTAITADGTTAIAAPIGPQSSGSTASAAVASARRWAITPEASAATSTTAPVVNFNVSTCGVAENFAHVEVDLEGPVPANLIVTPASNAASYQAILPTGATGNVTSLLQKLPSFLGPFCNVVGTNVGGGSSKPALQAAICSAVVIGALEFPLAARLVPAACGPAGAALASAVQVACAISNNQGLINSLITFLTEPTSLFWLAQLQSLSNGSPPPKHDVVNQLPFPGGYPTVNVDFGCPEIGKVNIDPHAVGIPPAAPSPLLAQAFGPDNRLLESSSIIFTWNSNDTTVATVPSSGQQAEEGTRNQVTGQATGVGKTTDVSAIEQRTGTKGNASVFVCPFYCALDYPGSQGSAVVGIDSNLDTVGWYFDQAGNRHGFLSNAGLSASFDYDPSSTSTAIQGIDDYAEMVGYYVDKSGAEHGFLLSAETPNSIDYPGSTGTQAAGINNSGQIVGHYLNQVGGGKHGFLYEVRSSAVTSCSIPCSFDFPGSILTIAYGINTSGQIVGEYYDQAGNEHGFLYSGYTISGGSLSGGSFNSIDYPNAKGTSVKGINDKSQMVGHYFDTAGAAHAFIYSGWTLTGGTLGGGVSSSFDYPNASDTRAYDVNNSGQIVGIYYDKAGIEHGFLRMPQ